MDQCNWSEVLGQASVSEAGAIFREYLRGGMRTIIAQVMAAEVAELCGEKYHPSEEDARVLQRSLESDRDFIDLRSTIDKHHQGRNRASSNSRERQAEAKAARLEET